MSFIDFRGWRFFPPYFCMGCGIETSEKQWAYGRCCGSCDMGSAKTYRAPAGKGFVGKVEKLPQQDGQRWTLDPQRFLDPATRLQYPLRQGKRKEFGR